MVLDGGAIDEKAPDMAGGRVNAVVFFKPNQSIVQCNNAQTITRKMSQVTNHYSLEKGHYI